MSLIERVLDLSRLAPFDALRESELIAVADVCRSRIYGPGERLAQQGEILPRLVLVVEGGFVTAQGQQAPDLIGLSSVLLARELEQSLQAGTEGARSLEIAAGHVFTLVNECPSWTLGCLGLRDVPED